MDSSVERITHLLRTRVRMSHFVLLDAIAREGSLHRASVAQGVSQPAITKSLREIEVTLGCQIFQRTKHGVRPTKVGQYLIDAARAMLKDLDRVSTALVAAARGDEGLLRLGFIPMVARSLVARSIEHLTAKRRLCLVVITGTTNEIVAAIRDHRCDCGLVRSAVVDPSGDMVFDEIYRQRAVIVRGAGSAVTPPESLTEMLRNEKLKWILPPPATPTRILLDRAFISAGMEPRLPEIECFDVRLIEHLLAQDPYRVAIFPEDVAEELRAVQPLAISSALPNLDLPPVCLARLNEMNEDPNILELLRILRSFKLSD